ncbi:MAG TPA: hypothetical protein VEO53_07230, partial [Candidatus Binatia bacterium]|nr:hypothetical protein [Candidatus Binatia bacterium]
PQGVVAQWLGVTQGQLSRIENGAPVIHLDRLMYWARVFKMPAARLWFTLPDANTAPDMALAITTSYFPPTDLETSALWESVDTIEETSQFTRRDLTVDRREAVRAAASVVFGSALLEPLERWLISPAEKHTAARPGAVGHQEVIQIEHAAQLFREWDDQFGGGLRRKAVVGQLNEVADLLRDSHPAEIRRRLFGVMAQLAETAAIMSWDSGEQLLAQRYYVLALRATKPAGDLAFAANVMAGMARQLLYLGHVSDALELVRIAQDSSAHLATPTIRAMLHTREAWGYARQGRLSAFRRATAKAEDALSEAYPSEDPHWIAYFDVAELAGTTGGRLLDLAHEQPALADETGSYIEQAIRARGPGHLRSAALDHIGLAEARLIQGELEEAARLGHEAVAVIEQTRSDRVRVKLVELYQHATVHAAVPAIAGFRDRVRSLVTATSGAR